MIAAIILAAGNSTRMGSPKAFLAFRGSTFLETIQRTCLEARLSPIIVVVGKDTDKRLQETVLGSSAVIVNPDVESGPIGSISLAIRGINHSVDGAVIWPTDHPCVAASTVRGLAANFKLGKAAIVVPSVRQRRGHPVIVGQAVFSEIHAAARSGRTLRDVVRADPSRVSTIEVNDHGILQDVDTPGDYAALD